MDLQLWLGFVAATLMLLSTPGQVVMFTVTAVLARGRSAILPVALGAVSGDVFAMAVSLAGISALVGQWPGLLHVVKALGGLLLIAIGTQTFRNAAGPREAVDASARRALAPVAFVMTAFHPMSFVFFGAFFPAFTTTEQPLLPQIIVLALTFLVLVVLSIIVWGAIAVRVGEMVKGDVRVRLTRFSGGFLASIGVVMLVVAVRSFV